MINTIQNGTVFHLLVMTAKGAEMYECNLFHPNEKQHKASISEARFCCQFLHLILDLIVTEHNCLQVLGMSVRMFYFENLRILLSYKRSILIVIYEWNHKKGQLLKHLLNFTSYFQCSATAGVRSVTVAEE